MTNLFRADPASKGADATSDRVAQLATSKGVLNSVGTALIGIVGPQDALRALVMAPSGRTRFLARGDSLSNGKIVGIDDTGLVLQKHGNTSRLDLPTP